MNKKTRLIVTGIMIFILIISTIIMMLQSWYPILRHPIVIGTMLISLFVYIIIYRDIERYDK
jgi:CHASE2 domain-containing sensor protein